MSTLKVANINGGGTVTTSAILQHVTTSGGVDTLTGNKIEFKPDGTNTVSGDTTFNDDAVFSGDTTTKYVKHLAAASNITASSEFGKIVVFQNGETVTVDDITSTTAGGIISIINTGASDVTISKGTGVTMIHLGTGLVALPSLALAQHGMCTIYSIKISGGNTISYVSGVGLS